MKFLLDQMFRIEVLEAMKSKGFDVIRVAERGLSRAEDDVILELAIREQRILITLDEHFGNWVILPLKVHSGVIRLKVHPAITENILKVLLPFLEDHKKRDFKDYLAIVSSKQIKWIYTNK